MNFTSNHQNMSELFIPQTTIHLFYITVDVISNVNTYYIYMFAVKERKDDFRSIFKGKTCSFLNENFISFYYFLPFKLNARFTFSYTVLNLANLSLALKLNVDFTVSYSLLLNFAMFSFNSSIFKSKFCLHFFCVFCVVRTSHSSLLQSAYCFFLLLSKCRAFHCTCYFQTVAILSFVQAYNTSQSLLLRHPKFLPFLKSERNCKSSIRQYSHFIHYFCHSGSTHTPNLLPTFIA
jgi:hypothetical protein